MDDPISTLSESTGRPAHKTHQPADAVIGFLEEKLPEQSPPSSTIFIEGTATTSKTPSAREPTGSRVCSEADGAPVAE